jgi:hypothetical protein
MFQPIPRENDEHSQMLIQPSLEIGREDDEHEKEADHVADKVMKMSDPEEEKKKMPESKPLLQKMSSSEPVAKMPESRPLLQKMGTPEKEEEEEPLSIQKKTDGSGNGMLASKNVEQGINSSKGSGQSLSPDLQDELGGKMNANFSGVKVHTDEKAVQMNKEVGAKAFTHGNDIYFNKGQYNPTSNQGKHLLAHELTHTVQQSSGKMGKIQKEGDEWKTVTVDNTNPDQSNVYRISLDIIKDCNLDMKWEEVGIIIKTENGLNNEYGVANMQQLKVPTCEYFQKHHPSKIKTNVNEVPETQTEKDDRIRKEYFAIVDKGEAHYMEAIQYLIDTYGLDATYATMSYDATITNALAITGGAAGDYPTVPVRFSPIPFDKGTDFGIICRGVAHELMHSKQKVLDKMGSHDEREFLAYYDTLTRTDMPEIKDMVNLKIFVTKAINYYNNLPLDKQTLYASKKKEVDDIKTKHGF